MLVSFERANIHLSTCFVKLMSAGEFRGRPEVWVASCNNVTYLLPAASALLLYSGTYLATSSARLIFFRSTNCINIVAVNVFVTDKMGNFESMVAGTLFSIS